MQEHKLGGARLVYFPTASLLRWEVIGVPVATLVLIAVFGFLNPRFAQLSNAANLGRQLAPAALAAWGQTMVIITGGIDLSVGSVAALVSVVTASLAISYGQSVGITAGLALGALIGLINGVFVSRLGLPPFVVTLAMMSIARGAALTYTGGVPVFGLHASFLRTLGGGSVLGIPVSAIVAVAVLVIVYVALTRTRFGLTVYAMGGNEQAAILAGLPVARYKTYVYLIAGFLAGASGVLLTGRMNSGQPLSATGLELQTIAAVCIGGTSLLGGRGSVLGTCVGLILVGILTNGLDIVGVSSFIQQMITGAVILISVLTSTKRGRFVGR